MVSRKSSGRFGAGLSPERARRAAIFRNEETAAKIHIIQRVQISQRDLGLAQEHQMGSERSAVAGAIHTGSGGRLVARNDAEGVPVYAPDGNRLGRIERVMADEGTGEIAYAIVNFGFGRSIGFESDDHPVPWSLLVYNPRFDGYELRIADKQTSPRT
jgi:hypothetical protein